MKDDKKTKVQLIEDLDKLRTELNALTLIQEKSEKIFQHSHDAIFLLDPENNKILDVNPSASNMLGYSREDLLKLPISAIHPSEMKQFLTFFKMPCTIGI